MTVRLPEVTSAGGSFSSVSPPVLSELSAILPVYGSTNTGGAAAALLSSTRPVEEASEPSALTDMISRSRSVNFSVNGLRESFTSSSSALACGTT